MIDVTVQNPPEAGWWNVSYEGVMSFMPMYAYFDGKTWDNSREDTAITIGRKMYWWPNTRTDSNPTPSF